MREILVMNYDWKFFDGDIADRSFDCTHENVSKSPVWLKSGNNGLAKWGYPDTEWEDVDLPHDFVNRRSEFTSQATPSQGSLAKGLVWYRKAFDLNLEDREKCITIELDGIFRNYQVWFNGHLLGTEISGYKSVSYKVDDVCRYDDVNVIAIRVDATEYEGWWYEGGGLYRNVRLVKTSKLFVPQWGTYVRGDVAEDYKSAEVKVDTRVKNENDQAKDFKLVSQIMDAEGKVLKEVTKSLSVDAYDESTDMDALSLEGINLWAIDNPYLYTLKTLIMVDGEVADTYETIFGIRSVTYCSETGFYLNGKNIKLKGVCCHEDHAGVGVALPDGLHEYRIKLLKEMGCNAYRSSHNPPTPAIIEACDRLGMVVMDETRIMDTCPEYTEQLETLIKRDRNHPSVILWSVGNEEMNIHGTDIGMRIYKRLIRIANRLDPSRKTIYACNCNWCAITEFNEENGFSVEVNGLNYNQLRLFEMYDQLHEQYPETIMIGTENASTLSTRGLYCENPETKAAKMTQQAAHECIFEKEARNNIVSGYGEVYPPWGSTPMETWTHAVTRPFVGGVFVWTGFDYRGETIPYVWPCTVSHFGIMDLCGFPKDIYYYYKSWWTDEDTLHIFPHWNWAGSEGKLIDVCIFCNMDTVELFLNGESLGTKEVTIEVKPTWEVPYTPGELKAVGYRDGKEVMTKIIETTDQASTVKINTNKTELIADRKDICIINIEAIDQEGRFVQTANDLLKFSVNGPGRILGTGNGNPMSHEADALPERKLFNGLCQVIVQTTFDAGTIEFVVTGEGYKEQSVTLRAKATEDNKYVAKIGKDISEAKIMHTETPYNLDPE